MRPDYENFFLTTAREARLRLKIDADDQTPTVSPRGRRGAKLALKPHSLSHFEIWVGEESPRQLTWAMKRLPKGGKIYQLGDLEATVHYPNERLTEIAQALGCIKRQGPTNPTFGPQS